MIKAGIITQNNIQGVPFEVHLIPETNTKARPKNSMTPTSITIHNTGNTNKGADATAHTKYVDNVNNYVSWHFTVDDRKIYQELPVNENAWHAGDGASGLGNLTSIAIEICENEGIEWGKAKENAVKLIRYLKHELGITEIVPHQKWSGKYCPSRILNEGWDAFLMTIDNDEVEQLRQENNTLKSKLEKIKIIIGE